MTFSLRPISVSFFPSTAACVSTRVVSWKQAAEMNERVCSEALVMPSSTGLPSAGFLPFVELGVDLVHLLAVDLLARQQRGVAAVGDLDLLQHLANDHLDVLVVDLHALQPVDLLDLVDEVLGQRLDPQHFEDVVRVRASREISVSPFLTKSPSWTSITLVLGTRYSTGSPSSGTIAILRLAL